ncbi:hypothetical protein [Nocardioides sp. MH1]|uniref:hypothetical protein n=1 Tax=Nocardioides sp. MH1 TaxID=3242490 RepID=UPI0035228798
MSRPEEHGSGLFVPDERWSPLSVLLRGVLTTLTGLAIAWWLRPGPDDGAGKAMLTYAGLGLALIGVAMVGYGVWRVVEVLTGRER